MIVHLVNKDYTDIAEDLVKLGFWTPNRYSPNCTCLRSCARDAIGQSVGTNFKSITDAFSDLMYEYPFRVPAKFALIIRSPVTQGLHSASTPISKLWK